MVLRIDKIKRVGIVGAGLMGHGIAQAYAQEGYPITITDESKSALAGVKDRIKANLFYDYGLNFDKFKQKHFRSAGVELLLDHHWFSFPIEFEGGYRFSYRQEDKKIRHEIIFQLPLD